MEDNNKEIRATEPKESEAEHILKSVDGAITDGDKQYIKDILETNKKLAEQVAELQKTNLALMNKISVEKPTTRSSEEILNSMFK